MTSAKKPVKSKTHKQYNLEQNQNPSYNEDITVQEALGSIRKKKVHEAGRIRSKNYRKGVAGWELTPQGSSFPLITFSETNPVNPPTKIGDIHINTAIGRIWISSGTNISEWRQLN